MTTLAAESEAPARPRVTMRAARRDDNARLCEVFRAVQVDADLMHAVERDPDFFAFYDIETPADDQFVIAFESEGRVEGVGAMLAREAHLNGGRTRVGYLADLRFEPAIRGAGTFRTLYRETLEEGRRRLGVEVFTTIVLDENEVARRALVERDPRWPDKPLYRPFRNFELLAVQLAHSRPARRTGVRVRHATMADLPEIAEVLRRDQSGRPFGQVIDASVLEKRIARWPRFSIDQFYLAHDTRGRLVGVVATWDPFDVQRIRMMGMRDAMRWKVGAYNFFARALGGKPMPGPGELMRYFYLTHLAVPSADPAVMAALVDRVHAEHLKRGEHHFFFAYVGENDPLARAFRGYARIGTRATLYTVTSPESPWASVDFGAGRPGFEMSLV